MTTVSETISDASSGLTLVYGISPGYTVTLGPNSQKPRQPVSLISTSSSFTPTWPARPRFSTSSLRESTSFLAPRALHPLTHTAMTFFLGSLRAAISFLSLSSSDMELIRLIPSPVF